MKPKNIKEFQALVKRYETITLDEIVVDYIENPRSKDIEWQNSNAQRLTGFGSKKTCTLCVKVDNPLFCEGCVYTIEKSSCISGGNSKTYCRICNADTPRKLLNAYRARAKHLRKTYPQYLKS